MVGNSPGSANLGPRVFFIWGSLCILSLTFAYFLVPEMKGLSLEQVDKMMEEVSPRKSASWIPHTTFAEEMRRINAAKAGGVPHPKAATSPLQYHPPSPYNEQQHAGQFFQQYPKDFTQQGTPTPPPPQGHYQDPYQQTHTPPLQEYHQNHTPSPQHYHQTHTPPPQNYQQQHSPSPHQYQQAYSPPPQQYQQEQHSPPPHQYQQGQSPPPQQYYQQRSSPPQQYQQQRHY